MLKKYGDSERALLVLIGTILLFFMLLFFGDPLFHATEQWIDGSKYLSKSILCRDLEIEALTMSALQDTYQDRSVTFEQSEKLENTDYIDRATILHAPDIGLWASHEVDPSAENKIQPIHYLFLSKPNIRFGWLNIGVGSKRSLVEFAFLLDTKRSDDGIKIDLSHLPRHAIPNGSSAAGNLFSLGYTGAYNIYFNFDAHDRVEYILILFFP